MPSDAELLAGWIRTLLLSERVFVTGATMIVADVKARHPGRFEIDERRRREDPAPEGARRYALESAERYQEESGEDGKRVAGLCQGIATRIADHVPERTS